MQLAGDGDRLPYSQSFDAPPGQEPGRLPISDDPDSVNPGEPQPNLARQQGVELELRLGRDRLC